MSRKHSWDCWFCMNNRKLAGWLRRWANWIDSPENQTTVIHIQDAPPDYKRGPNYIYIGPESYWGNPYRVGVAYPDLGGNLATQDQVYELYETNQIPNLINFGTLRVIKGKILVCPCNLQPCHGDLLAQAADEHGFCANDLD